MEIAYNKSKLFNKNAIQKCMTASSLVIMFVIFSVASPNFLTLRNMSSLLEATAINGILALAVTFVIITGGIDLSIGTVMTFSGVIAGVIITKAGLPVSLGILGAMLAGGMCGFINGFNISKFKTPPFIATLGMMMITKGLNLVVSSSSPIYFTDKRLFGIIDFSDISLHKFWFIPSAVVVFFIIAICTGVILNKTLLGRYCFAIGSNEEATRLSGINTNKWLIIIYSLTGIICGIAGVIMAGRLNSVHPSLGPGYELEAIAAVVIGGTSLSGGRGTISGTVIGAFVISVLMSGLGILSVSQEWKYVITGIIVVTAVISDEIRKRRLA